MAQADSSVAGGITRSETVSDMAGSTSDSQQQTKLRGLRRLAALFLRATRPKHSQTVEPSTMPSAAAGMSRTNPPAASEIVQSDRLIDSADSDLKAVAHKDSTEPNTAVKESELKGMLRANFRPEADDDEPRHLLALNDVLGPRLRVNLNDQFAEMGSDATLPTVECGHCGGLPPGGLRILRADISGSVADRIGWLTIQGVKMELVSDHDFMLELNVASAPLSAEAESGAAEPCLAQSDTPGYYRLLLGRSEDCRHPQRRELTAAAVRAAMTEAVRRHLWGKEPRTSGPAVTLDSAVDSAIGLFQLVHGVGDIDCVPCVTVREDAAAPWLAALSARRRAAGWPGDALLARLAGVLHLVPVGPQADDVRLWRLSFSRPEAMLVRGLPPAARYCLMLLRLVRVYQRSRLADVSSYYLKTCVFWLCLQQPEAHWQDPLTAMRAVLDMLERAVSERFLPSFFWEELNVLRDPTPVRLAALRRAVRYFQDNLVFSLHVIFRMG